MKALESDETGFKSQTSPWISCVILGPGNPVFSSLKWV